MNFKSLPEADYKIYCRKHLHFFFFFGKYFVFTVEWTTFNEI